MTPLEANPETAQEEWAEVLNRIERLALAAEADNDNPDYFAAVQSLADLHSVLDPSTVRNLIAAARANSVGIAAGDEPSPDPTRAEAVAWRFMPAYSAKWFFSTTKPSADWNDHIEPLYAAPPSTEEGGGLREIAARVVKAHGACVCGSFETCSVPAVGCLGDALHSEIVALAQALARDGGKTA